jgi:hypothetical protein
MHRARLDLKDTAPLHTEAPFSGSCLFSQLFSVKVAGNKYLNRVFVVWQLETSCKAGKSLNKFRIL